MTWTITGMIEKAGEFLGGAPMAAVLILSGIYISSKCGFLQVRSLGYVLKTAVKSLFEKSGDESGGFTPMEALSTALGGTVGTGNITGVVVALMLGGPGSVFWMWVSAFVGMGTKYAEILLAVKHREVREDGEILGGPMYYIKNGLSEKWRPVAVIFSVFGMLSAFGIGNMMQIGSIKSGTEALFTALGKDGRTAVMTAAGASLLVALLVLGGSKTRGRAASFLVPFMSALYIFGTSAVIIAHIQYLPGVLISIFKDAFDLRSAAGGAAGGLIVSASYGIRRGISSHEAGMGSSPIAHAACGGADGVRQGFLGVFEVFMDTIVICTLTALMLLTSRVAVGGDVSEAALYCTAALGTVFGEKPSAVFLALALFLFAFSSVIGWSFYGERCVGFLFGQEAEVPYRIIFAAAAFSAVFLDFGTAVGISDILNVLMSLPNIAAVLALSGTVSVETKRHFNRLKGADAVDSKGGRKYNLPETR